MKNFIEFVNKNIEDLEKPSKLPKSSNGQFGKKNDAMHRIIHKKINSVELAGRSHYQFEKIHPFGDGNGRIGRLLMNFILWYNKYPIFIIEYKKRKSYYKALQKDEEHFVSYFIRRYLTIHRKRYLKSIP